MLRLDIGSRRAALAGYTAVDWSLGLDVRALPYAPESVEEILASHVLEHMANTDALPTLEHWVSLLKPGGIIRIAVPDFEAIIRLMATGAKDRPYEGWIMGGQTEPHDFHYTLWTEDKLRDLMTSVGLVDIKPFAGIPGTCSSVEISLNLVGTKPTHAGAVQKPPDLSDMTFVMTMPRLAWTDTMLNLAAVSRALNMECVKTSGVFYGQNMQRALEQIIAGGKYKYAVTLDYDTLFDWRDVARLRSIADTYALDAVAPLQSGRERTTPLFTTTDADGKPTRNLDSAKLAEPWFPCKTMHFGLTLLRLDSLKALPKPWFLSKPDERGEWGDGRIDDDIWFWQQAHAANWKYGLAPGVSVGHIETVAAWSDDRLKTAYQPLFNYLRSGKPWYVRDREQWRYGGDEPPKPEA